MRICGRRIGTFFLFLLVWMCPVVVVAQDACEQAYAAAEDQYTQGGFDQAASLLAPCMTRPGVLEPELEKQVYRLLALSYIRRGDLDEAQLAVLELLSRHADYEHDPVADPPAYVSLVTLVRQRFASIDRTGEAAPADESPPEPEPPAQPRSFLRSPVTWISVGGGALLTTIIVLAAGGGGGNGGGPGTPGSSLPLPPGLP